MWGGIVAGTVALATRLKQAGVDLIDVSTGGAVPDARIPVAPKLSGAIRQPCTRC